MIKVTVKTFGDANRQAGWSSTHLELPKVAATIADVLRSATIQQGGVLYDVMVEKNILKDTYAMFINGQLVWHPVDLTRKIRDGDVISLLDFPFNIGGG